jgi:hypothetical protein
MSSASLGPNTEETKQSQQSPSKSYKLTVSVDGPDFDEFFPQVSKTMKNYADLI